MSILNVEGSPLNVRDEVEPLVVRNAAKLVAAFERAYRDSTLVAPGDGYWRLREGSPEWMTQAIHAAHGDMLPNDGMYERCLNAAEYISNLDSDIGYDDKYDHAHMWADQDVSIYTVELVRWLAEVPIARLALCDEALEEYGQDVHSGTPCEAMLKAGWYVESVQLFEAIWEACAEDHDDEEVYSDDA